MFISIQHTAVTTVHWSREGGPGGPTARKELITMFRSEAQAGSSRLIVDGLLALVVGGLILAFPGVTALTAVVLFAGWTFLNGVTEITAGVSVARAGGRSWPHAVSGIASLTTAVLAVA